MKSLEEIDHLIKENEWFKDRNETINKELHEERSSHDEKIYNHCRMINDIQTQHINIAEKYMKIHLNELHDLKCFIQECYQESPISRESLSYRKIITRYDKIIKNINYTLISFFDQDLAVFGKNKPVDENDYLPIIDIVEDHMIELTRTIVNLQNMIIESFIETEGERPFVMGDYRIIQQWLSRISSFRHSVGNLDIVKIVLEIDECLIFKKNDYIVFKQLMELIQKTYHDLIIKKETTDNFNEKYPDDARKTFYLKNSNHRKYWSSLFDNLIYRHGKSYCVAEYDKFGEPMTYTTQFQDATYSTEFRSYFDRGRSYESIKNHSNILVYSDNVPKDENAINSYLLFRYILEKYGDIRQAISVYDIKRVYENVYEVYKSALMVNPYSNGYDSKENQTEKDELNALVEESYNTIRLKSFNFKINHMSTRNIDFILNLLSSDNSLKFYVSRKDRTYPCNIKLLANISYWFNEYKKGNIELSDNEAKHITEMADIIVTTTFDYSWCKSLNSRQNELTAYYIGALELFDNDDIIEFIKNDELMNVRKKLNKLKLTYMGK